MKLLVLNPGSTSTKIAVFENEKSIFQTTLRHSEDELKPFSNIIEQFIFRKDSILNQLKKESIDINEISVIIGRGGILRPIESGVYEVNEAMKQDLIKARNGEHASNLGALIADEIARSLPSVKAYIADPVMVDELQDVARASGLPMFKRRSAFHALNQKAIARTYAESIGKEYEDINVIVAHMGGGISVGAHCKGKVIDVNDALGGEGPFSPERAGSVPIFDLVDVCYSGNYSKQEMKNLLIGKGGLVAHLGSNEANKCVKLAESGDDKALHIVNAMSYQVGKYIGSLATVLYGKVDGILITGGVAHNPLITDYIKEMTQFIAPVLVYAGEDEMAALVSNVLLCLAGKLPLKQY
ncbi:MAG: butyrate kinase [Bacteroidales bacterium]